MIYAMAKAGTRFAQGPRQNGTELAMTLIAIVATLLVISLGALNIAWGASHLMSDSRPLRLTSSSAESLSTKR